MNSVEEFYEYVELRATIAICPAAAGKALEAAELTEASWQEMDTSWRYRMERDSELAFSFKVLYEHFAREVLEALPPSQRPRRTEPDPGALLAPESAEPLRAAQLPSYLQTPVPRIETAPVPAPAQEKRDAHADETQLPTRSHQPALPFLPSTGPAQAPKPGASDDVEDRSGHTVGLDPIRPTRAQPTMPFQSRAQPEPTVDFEPNRRTPPGADATVGLDPHDPPRLNQPTLPFEPHPGGTKGERQIRPIPKRPEPTVVLSAPGAESSADQTVMLSGDENVNAAPDVPFATNDDGNLSLDQFMRLQAELTVWPEEAQALYAEYGLADEARRQRVQRTWRQRRETDSKVELHWSSSFTPLRIRLRNHKQSGKARRDAP